MSPPTSTEDKQGTVIDGKLRSAEWREKERAAQRSQGPRSSASGADVPATDFDAAAAKDFVSSLMIPVSSLNGEPAERRRVLEASGAHGDAVLTESPDLGPRSELEDQASERSEAAQSDELDRWFEDQATSVSCAPAAQKLPRGSASLEIETAAPVAKGTQRVRELGRRRVRTRESDEQRHGTARHQRLQSRVRVARAGAGRGHACDPVRRCGRDRGRRLAISPLAGQLGACVDLAGGSRSA